MPDDHALARMMEAQHSLCTREQARGAGFDRQAIERRSRRGSLVVLTPRVIGLGGVALTDERRAMAAVLDGGAGALLSHDSAAALWELPGFELAPPHVLVPRARSPRFGSFGPVHTSTFLPEHHGTLRNGIPVTTPTRLAFDLSGRTGFETFERTVERLWSRRLTNGARLYRMLDELSEHGRPKIQAIRDYLEPRGPQYRPSESGLELRVAQILARYGEPPLDRQVDVGDEHEWIGRVDMLDRALQFILEIDSELYHGSILERRLDEERTGRLEVAGFLVRRVREFDVWHHPLRVVEIVRDGRRAARLLRSSNL